MLFRRLAFLVLLATLVAGSPVLAAPADARPNILVIIADDWSWPHAGAYGLKTIKTPNFDRVAASGVLFRNAFTAAPTCTASRGTLLTGKHPHRLEDGGNLWSILPARHLSYPDLLSTRGYAVGQTGKGWSPGALDGSGRTHNPAGKTFPSFERFLKTVPDGTPFCFWHGSVDPHRPYDKGTGLKAGYDPGSVDVPKYLPDTPEVRSDILDYLHEVKRFDDTIGTLLDQLEKSGRLENTMVVVTSDNGWPFPRAKANLHDSGSHIPLAISWPGRIKQPRATSELVSLVDVAPTIVEAVGLPAEPDMNGRSLLSLMTSGEEKQPREFVVVERERHANVRAGLLGYPARAIRTRDMLYIRNFRSDRYPAGDPEAISPSIGPYGDIDAGPTKDVVLALAEKAGGIERDPFSRLALAKRPEEELYDLASDPFQLVNLAADPARAEARAALRDRLHRWMSETGDLRAAGETDFWDKSAYVGARGPGLPGAPVVNNPKDNTLTPLEKQLGWRLLFDGESLAGWTTEKKAPSRTPARDGAINPHKAGGYMLIYDEPFDDFVLSLDFKIAPKCNSGVFFRTWPLEPRPGKDVGYNGLEIAIDDTGTAGFHDTGAIYDLVKPSVNAMKPVGQWNRLVLIANGPDILVEINGTPVTRTRLSEWVLPNKRPDGSDHKFDVAFKDHPRKGYIGLQDHGGECWYKNIKIRYLRK